MSIRVELKARTGSACCTLYGDRAPLLVGVRPLEELSKGDLQMRTQKNWFKVALMTLAAVGLTLGALTLSAQADKQKGDDTKIVILYNQFEGGTKVKVDGLELLCVPTHKEIYEYPGKQTDGQKDGGYVEEPTAEYTYDHMACYKVFTDYEDYDHDRDDDKKD
jgi:hypothetical protein